MKMKMKMKMKNLISGPSSSSSVVFSFAFLLFFLFSASSASAFNITRLLNQFPEFGAFNDYLTKTRLFEQINTRQTITVLALDNSTVSAIAGNSLDVVKEILSAHVILDYYDTAKLRKLPTDKSVVLTTMFQSTGDAVNQQGFAKVLHNRRGGIEFGSAAKGAPFTAKLVGPVASQPYNISVLQISSPIVVPGIGTYNLPPPAPEAPVPELAPVDAPAPSPADDVDTEAPADAPTPASDAPAPAADAPDAPVSSPPKPADDVEDADAPGPADADSDDKSAGSRGVMAGAGVVVAGLVFLCLSV